MKNTIVAATAAVAMAMGSAAMAEVYGGVSAGQIMGEVSGPIIDGSESGRSFAGIVGYTFNDHVAVEGQLSSSKISEAGITAELDAASVFVSLDTGRSRQIGAYALLGGTYGRGKALGESESDTQMSYGAGIRVNATERVTVRMEYKVLAEEEALGHTATLSTATLGVTYRF